MPSEPPGKGPALIEAGRKAVASGSVAKMIAADLKFHEFIYGLSGNPLIAPVMASHWTQTQRVMGEVLMKRRDAARHLGPACGDPASRYPR